VTVFMGFGVRGLNPKVFLLIEQVAVQEDGGQAWSVGMIHSSLMEAWRGRVTM